MFLQKIKKSYFQRLATDGGAALSSLEVAMNVKRSLIGLQLPIVMHLLRYLWKEIMRCFFEWIYQHVHLFVYFCNHFKVFKHSCFFLSDKNRAPYFISEEIDIMKTGYATYYTLVLFDYRRLRNRTLQLDFLVIFGELYDFLSCYIWYFYKEFKYTHQHFQKVEFKSAY